MKRKTVEMWVMFGANPVRFALVKPKGAGWVRFVTEPDKLTPLYKRVALAAVEYFGEAPYKDGSALRLSRAVSALQKARRARR